MASKAFIEASLKPDATMIAARKAEAEKPKPKAKKKKTKKSEDE